jgi:hypothetical protein
MKKISSVLLISFMFSANAGAYTAYGLGNKSCGEWVAEKEKDSMSYLGMQAWVAGFISGVGFSAKFELKETDYNAIALFVTNYCKANPLDQVIDAAEALVKGLKEQQ